MSDSLLPPNTTPLERRLERVLTRATDLPTPLRDLWNPDSCPTKLLPWLAWSLGVTTWKSYWPESVRRSILRTAIDTKRRQGTALSVRTVVESFGAAVALREPRNGAPHHFEITINAPDMDGDSITAQFQQDIVDEVTRVKPARSYMTVNASLKAAAGITIATAGRAGIYRRLELTQ
ncbi:phage tail protein I [Shewanella sp.]|uniref:phage tail protein I n=1 Tax=Shewanella sp. TaxID=50422 RepID=UPI003A983314